MASPCGSSSSPPASCCSLRTVDPDLLEKRNTQRNYRLAAELERRARGDGLAQVFVDFAVYPGQHISMDWTDQWGKNNGQLSGFTFSLIDPIGGVGAAHYTRVPVLNSLVGGKIIVSIPNVLVRSISSNDLEELALPDPLLTVAGVVRVPFGRSNYGAVLTVSTNGQIGLGISLMNVNIPFLF